MHIQLQGTNTHVELVNQAILLVRVVVAAQAGVGTRVIAVMGFLDIVAAQWLPQVQVTLQLERLLLPAVAVVIQGRGRNRRTRAQPGQADQHDNIQMPPVSRSFHRRFPIVFVIHNEENLPWRPDEWQSVFSDRSGSNQNFSGVTRRGSIRSPGRSPETSSSIILTEKSGWRSTTNSPLKLLPV